jgi:hypothetical protein
LGNVYQSKYFAHDLQRRSASDGDRLATALFDAAVDLNPHRIEAALFAVRSPLAKGVLLGCHGRPTASRSAENQTTGAQTRVGGLA